MIPDLPLKIHFNVIHAQVIYAGHKQYLNESMKTYRPRPQSSTGGAPAWWKWEANISDLFFIYQCVFCMGKLVALWAESSGLDTWPVQSKYTLSEPWWPATLSDWHCWYWLCLQNLITGQFIVFCKSKGTFVSNFFSYTPRAENMACLSKLKTIFCH